MCTVGDGGGRFPGPGPGVFPRRAQLASWRIGLGDLNSSILLHDGPGSPVGGPPFITRRKQLMAARRADGVPKGRPRQAWKGGPWGALRLTGRGAESDQLAEVRQLAGWTWSF